MHYDGCNVTWNLMLSRITDYDGGGTYIRALGKTIKVSKRSELQEGSVVAASPPLPHLSSRSRAPRGLDGGGGAPSPSPTSPHTRFARSQLHQGQVLIHPGELVRSTHSTPSQPRIPT